MLAIIGRAGTDLLKNMDIIDEVNVKTPFGKPSSLIFKAKHKDNIILILIRHGIKYGILPHEINYRANIFALKMLGAKQIISTALVGTLCKNIKILDFVIPEDYFDWTSRARTNSFFGNGLSGHSLAKNLTSGYISKWIVAGAKQLKMTLHTSAKYACIEGPRLSTPIESTFLRDLGCNIIGMTLATEASLSKEARIAYAPLCLVTDDNNSNKLDLAKIAHKNNTNLLYAKILDLLNYHTFSLEQNDRPPLTDTIIMNKEFLSPKNKKILTILQA